MLHEQAAGYALDILDEDEREAFERHLETCAQCREEILSLARGRGRARVRRPRSRPPARAPGPPARERACRAAERRAAAPARAPPCSRLALRARGGRGRGGRDRARDLGREPVQLALEGARRPSAPSSRRSPSSPARPQSTSPSAARTARSPSRPDGRAALALSLPKAPSGKTYEAWVVQGKSAAPGRAVRGRRRDDCDPALQARADEQHRRRHGREGRRRESSHGHAHPDRRAHGLGFAPRGYARPMEPTTLDHIALWVSDRDTIADFLTTHTDMHVIDRTDKFTLVGTDARRGKLTLFAAEGPREPLPLRHVGLRVSDLAEAESRLPDGLELDRADGRIAFEVSRGPAPRARRGADRRRVRPRPRRALLGRARPGRGAVPRARLRAGLARASGAPRVEVGGAWVEFHEGAVAEPEKPLLNHLAVLVDSADQHLNEAKEIGVEVADFVDAPNTLAVFLLGARAREDRVRRAQAVVLADVAACRA